MPSTRSTGDALMSMREFSESEDDSDPDYRESSADDEDELPKSMARDRAQWVVDNHEALAELYAEFKDVGRHLFGEAFFQCGNITVFSHFVYRHTMPGAAP
tara:strand:- start:418 stop:720 length:303 start_codon:yes stop_codon:yes gene_type:complete